MLGGDMRAFITAALVTVAFTSSVVLAQAREPNAAHGSSLIRDGQAMEIAASGKESTIPQQQPQSGSGKAPGSLSEELSRSGGIIHPPASGDGNVVLPPNQRTSRTPIIPPPGTPGGNPLVQPK